MKRKIVLLGLLVAVSASKINAQKAASTPMLEFKDPQFEHPVGTGATIPDWPACNGSPDIQPVLKLGVEVGVRVSPKEGNGNSYVGILCVRDKLLESDYSWQEVIYQPLIKPMKKGITYKLSIDLMVPRERWEYDPYGPPRNQGAKQHVISGDSNPLARRRSKPGAIAVRGANSTQSCAKAKVLWRSKTVQDNSEWVTETFTITPDMDYAYFIITPEIPDEVNNTKDATGSAEIVDYVCIDNIRSYPDSTSSNVKSDIYLSKAFAFISPNPVHDRFSLTVAALKENTVIELYNCLGDLIYKQEIINEHTLIDISQHAKGLYFVRVVDGDNIISTQKIIKQ